MSLNDLLSAERITAAQAATLVRADLRRTYPGTKFSVRTSTYSMGAHVHVTWVDGPGETEVFHRLEPIGGKRFDGMTDSSSYADTWTCTVHGFSVASAVGEVADACCTTARLVHSGADSVSTTRTLSPAITEALAAWIDTARHDDVVHAARRVSVTPRTAIAAADALGDDVVDIVCGRDGLSGADHGQLTLLVALAEVKSWA